MFAKRKQRRHFKNRVQAVDEAIWDLSFQREKLRMLREDVRKQYDRINEPSVMAQKKLEEEKNAEKSDKKMIENLEAVVAKYAPDLEQKAKQIEGLDNEISGEGNPQSCESRIEGFRALKAMYLEYLCKL